jgi:pantetheine hydrolase
MKVVDRPVEPEFITFDTPFGKFGTFTCFDVLFHDPAIPLVEKYNIDHVVFPTAWFDVLPLFPAIGFHSSWARGMRVNYLGSNTHVPLLLNTGSGIYTPTGAKAFYRSLSGNGALLTASLPVSPRNISRNTTQMNNTTNYLSDGNETNTSDEFYSDLFGDLFLFKELSKKQDSLNLCYNSSKTCCSLTYKMANKQSDEMYALGVFDGLHTKEGQYYLRICTLIKCLNLNRDSCGQRVYSASTIFESIVLKSTLNTSYVFPQVVADGVSLLPGEWTNEYPANSLQTTQTLSKGLLTAALFGRVYNLDSPTPIPATTTSSTHSSTATVTTKPTNMIFMCLLLICSQHYA